jgi:chromosome segregation ATPase
LSFEQQPSPDRETDRPVPDFSALDAALREVIAAARIEHQAPPTPVDVPDEDAGDLHATLDVVSRAATTIDQLIERNRALTEATVRSVDFLRKDAAEARAEAEALRTEAAALREENEAIKAAALAHADELEAELDALTQELERTRAKMADLCAHVATLLGNVETRLGETKADHLL